MDQGLKKFIQSQPVRTRFLQLHAVSGKMRYLILSLLYRCPNGLTVKELSQILSTTHSNISHQLAVLRRHGLITPAKKGRTVSYTIAKRWRLPHLFET